MNTNDTEIIVSKTDKDCFNTITEALEYANKYEQAKIFIKSGSYYEKLNITHKNIELIGENKDTTIITYDDYAFKMYDDNEQYGTFRTYTVNTSSDNITFANLTIKNTAGVGSKVGQAVSLSLCAKFATIKNCIITANQDTIFMSPFPPAPIIKDSFKGDFDKNPDLVHKNLFENCYISGDIDFIFGGGIAYFDECELFSNDLGKDINGYITAPSTPIGFEFGFVFNNCNFTSNSKKDSVYLGRPWRNYAKSVFLNCNFGGHIKKEGFSNWDKIDSEKTTFFAEYNCKGVGSDLSNRCSFSKVLNDNEALKYTKENIFTLFL